MAKLICGCGYLGLRVARRWIDAGETVWAVTRSQQRARQLEKEGIRPIVLDVTRPFALPNACHDVTTVLFAIGFDRTPGQSLEEVYGRSLEHSLAALPRNVERFIYISTTGVYGDAAAEWINEDTLCEPVRPGARASLAGERFLAASPFAAKTLVLRLAGIYGEERLPKRTALEQGQPLAAHAAGLINLIHVDDAAEIIVDLERLATTPQTLLVADGHPVSRHDFYGEMARLLGTPSPKFVEPAAGDAERGSGDKRIDNRRLQELLTRPLRYPTYREGLKAILKG